MEDSHVRTGRAGLLEKIAYGILLAITFLIPIFFVPVSFISTQFGTSLLFAFGTIVAAILYIIATLASGSIVLPRVAKYILGAMIAVPVCYTLAGIANGFSRMSFFGYTFDESTVGFILLAFVYLFLVSVLFRNKNRILYSYFFFVLSSLLSALFIAVRLVFGAKVLAFGMFTDLTSTVIGSWNNVGIFFGISAILSLLTHEMLHVSKLMKSVLLAALAASLFFLALVNFGAVWIILGICSLAFLLYSFFSSKSKRISYYSIVVCVISAVFIIWGSTLGAYLSNHLNVSNVEVRPSLSVTMDIARNTLKTRPLFGSGPNTFVTQWLSFKPDDVTSTIYWNTDFTNGIGLLPTFAVTTGIFGILSWILFLGFFLYLGGKAIFSPWEDSFAKYLGVSSFFVSLYLWIMAFIYVPSAVIIVLTFFFTGLFFASAYVAGVIPVTLRVFSDHPRTGFLSSLAMVALFVASLGLGYGLLKNSQSLWYFQKSSYALNTAGDITGAENYMNKAISAVPYDVYYRALSEIEIFKLNAVLSQDPKQVKPEDAQKQFNAVLSDAIKAGIAAKDADPINYLNWIALARVYEAVSVPQLQVQGAYQSAQFAYGEALRRNPKNPGILVLLSRLAVTGEDLPNAKAYALQAIQQKQNYLDAYFLLAQIEVANKNVKGAIDSVQAATVIDPTNSAVFFQLGLLKYNTQDYGGAIDALEKSVALVPDYANAKYFLGLSYEAAGQHAKAIQEFQDLKKSNPDSKEVDAILANLLAGKPIVNTAAAATTAKPQPVKSAKLPVKEAVQQ
jgi:cytochrome c-type biogenesis protein CcmH/NrfG